MLYYKYENPSFYYIQIKKAIYDLLYINIKTYIFLYRILV